jgi:hypothetical protein
MFLSSLADCGQRFRHMRGRRRRTPYAAGAKNTTFFLLLGVVSLLAWRAANMVEEKKYRGTW